MSSRYPTKRCHPRIKDSRVAKRSEKVNCRERLGAIKEHPRLEREFLGRSDDRVGRCGGDVATACNGSGRMARCGRVAKKFGRGSALKVSAVSSDGGHWYGSSSVLMNEQS